MRSRKALLIASILTIILLMSLSTANQITTESGRIKTNIVKIQDGDLILSGLLHLPPEAHPDNPRPAVIVTHGISSTKEMVDGIALELARRGYVAMSIDLHGHGDSEGQLSVKDPSFGLEAALDFIRSYDFVDKGLIGVAGHSLGAGAARVVALGGEIHATVFIAGGISGDYMQEGILTTINPKNLLVAVGSHDVLFRIEDLFLKLKPVFGTDRPVEPGVTYGNFQRGDARRLVVRPTTHLFEPMHPGIVTEVVAWFTRAFNTPSGRDLHESNQIYLWRESCLLIALVSLFGVTLLIPMIVSRCSRLGFSKNKFRSGMKISDSRTLLFWGLPGIILFIPLMGVGAFIAFPPQLFGSSIAWWLFSVAVAGMLLFRFGFRRESIGLDYYRKLVASTLRKEDLVISLGLFAVMYLTTILSERILNINFRFFIPILNSLEPVVRVFAFPTYFPFLLVYFLVDGVYMFELREKEGYFVDIVKVLCIKLLPYLFVIAMQYIPMYTLNQRLFSGFIGFILEFVWGVVPILGITTICSWWLHRLTGRIWSGTLFNTLLVAWIAASLFPYGSLSTISS